MEIDPNLMRDIIMDHYENPQYKREPMDNSYKSIHMDSTNCVDDITVQADIEDNVIKDVRFDGVACTISTASTSIMTELVKGKTVDQAKKIIDNYFAMIDDRPYDSDMMEEAIAFKNVGKQANRINCATIGWKALRDIITESEEK